MTEAVAGQAVGGGGTPTGAAPGATATQAGGGLDWGKVDWNNFDPTVLPRNVIERHPDFNGLKSAMDKRLSATERRYQEQLAQAQQAAQGQLAQLQTLLGNRMDDGIKRDLSQWQADQEMARLRQENESLRAYYGRQSMLDQFSKQHGIPLEDLADVENPSQMYERVVGHQAKMMADLQKQMAELTAKMSGQAAAAALAPVDQGGGASTTGQADVQRRYDEAMRARNSKLADQIQFEAIDKGFNLDLYSFRKQV